MALCATLLLTMIVVLIVGGSNAGSAVWSFFVEPLITTGGIADIINRATVLALPALGIAIMFECRVFSFISEGAFMLGGCLTAMFILGSNTQASGFLIAVGLIVGMLAGLAAVLPSALLNGRKDVNITFTSVITNFIILGFTTFILLYFMNDTFQSEYVSFAIPESERLPMIIPQSDIRLGTLIAAACCIGGYVLLNKTRKGYEIYTVGASEVLAGYVGLSSKKVALFSQLVCGVLCGLGGAIFVMSGEARYLWAGEFSYIGYTAIIVALFAGCNPALVPFAALLFGYIFSGSNLLSETTTMPAEFSGLVQITLMILMVFCHRAYADIIRFARWVYLKTCQMLKWCLAKIILGYKSIQEKINIGDKNDNETKKYNANKKSGGEK